jgi:predicted NAD/FAD-dependent oxidoreductase
LKVAVIGAGVAGLTCARTLDASGLQVVVFDKARGPGGRTSTRRGDGVAFDHGAQYFTCRSEAFSRRLEDWVARGVARAWTEPVVDLAPGGRTRSRKLERRWVGVPGMNALAKDLAKGLRVEVRTRVERIERERAGWCLRAEQGEDAEGFDAVLVATPAPQAVPLLATVPALADHAEAVRTDPCWTLMLAFEEPLGTLFGGAFVADSPLGWIARDASKPGRGEAECWVLQATPEWSRSHLEDEADAAADTLLEAFETALGRSLAKPSHAAAHRWRYARTTLAAGSPCLWHAPTGIGACGDWLLGARVEAAFESGAALAATVLESERSRLRGIESDLRKAR